MSKQDVIEVEGKVLEALPNAMFQVQLSLRQMQNYQAQRSRHGYLRKSQAQTASGIIFLRGCFK